MNHEFRPPLEETHSGGAGAPHSATAPDHTVRGVLQGAIQKVMEEIDRHEQQAKRHLQQAEDLRKELLEGIRIVKQEARASAKAATRTEPADGAAASVDSTDASAAAKPPRAESKKKSAGRKGKK